MSKYDENFDNLDWGDVVPEPPHPQWKGEDFRYGEDWMDSESTTCCNGEPTPKGKSDE